MIFDVQTDDFIVFTLPVSFRCEQARTIVKPFVSNYKSKHKIQLPTPKIIRPQIYKLSIQDHVHKLGNRLLQAVEVHSYQARLLTWSITTANSLATGTDAEID